VKKQLETVKIITTWAQF